MKCLEPFNMFIKVCLGLERSPNTAFFWKFPHLDGWWGIFSWSWLTEDSCLPVLQLCTEVPWDFACSRVNTFVRRQHLVPVIERQGFASPSPTIFQGKEARLRQTLGLPIILQSWRRKWPWDGVGCCCVLGVAVLCSKTDGEWSWLSVEGYTLSYEGKKGCTSCISEFSFLLIFTLGISHLNWTLWLWEL